MDKAAASAQVTTQVSAMASVTATAWASILVATIALLPAPVLAQDYEKEQRWATDIQSTLMVGNAVWLTQKGARSSRFNILPGPDFGSGSLRKSICLGTL